MIYQGAPCSLTQLVTPFKYLVNVNAISRGNMPNIYDIYKMVIEKLTITQ